MRHSSFEIRNFKGIRHAKIPVDTSQHRNILTLVGLNESGKTTVLEAINMNMYKADDLNPLALSGYSLHDLHELIPIGRLSNFSDEITITTEYVPDSPDQEAIREYLFSNLGFDLAQDVEPFTTTQIYRFQDSKLTSSQPDLEWSIDFRGKRRRGRKEVSLDGDDWQAATDFVEGLLPSILYFPNFLFEFPDRIYLEDDLLDSEKQRLHSLYRAILQDVLNAIGEQTTIERHILDRAKSDENPDKRALESVLAKMGTEITTHVFDAWNRIFDRQIGNKEITLECNHDDVGGWYIELRLKDGNAVYTIGQRSLGFRWFFAFLLLTHYRGFRQEAPTNTLFLLDEPASNLHPSAQTQLLKSFAKFRPNCSIIYTTHSHHLINPDWLEDTFVVRNEGLEYDSNEDDFNATQTVITVQRYREFASQHPNQTTYFQPILDILDYAPGKLENIPDVIMIEGKFDYYTLRYFQDIVLKQQAALNLMPGSGAGSLDDVIRLYIAWGRNFIVLLDSDTAGTSQAKRYKELFGVVVDGRMFTLGDVDAQWKNAQMESLLLKSDRIKLQNLLYPDSRRFNKKQFNRAIQELFLTRRDPGLDPSTVSNFDKLVRFCAAKVDECSSEPLAVLKSGS